MSIKLLSGPTTSSATQARGSARAKTHRPFCRSKYPMQPAARLPLRDKDVLRRMLDHRLQQLFTAALHTTP
jgi:hypothetical protein